MWSDDSDELREGLAAWTVRTDLRAAFEAVARKRLRRRLVRWIETGVLVVAVAAGTAGGILALSRAFAGRSKPVGPPGGIHQGLIAFERVVGPAGPRENVEIFTVDVATGRRRRLTLYPGRDEQPALSPDGTRIAFTRGGFVPTGHGHGATLRQGIFVMDADGGNVRQLTGCPRLTCPSSDSAPAWSPDGRRIAFVRGGAAIWAVGSNGGSPRRLCGECEGGDRVLLVISWSPDGRTIVFSVAEDVAHHLGNAPILALDVATGRARALTRRAPPCVPDCEPLTGVLDGTPAWSPDGTRVAFTRRAGFGAGFDDHFEHIMVVGSDGSNLRDLIGCPTSLRSDGCIGSAGPAWSADGNEIAFISYQRTAGHLRSVVYVMRSDGRDPHRVAGTEGVTCCLSWNVTSDGPSGTQG